MNRIRIISVFVLLTLFASAALAQKTGGNPKLYDDFSGNLLSVERWQPTGPSCGGNVLECVREIGSSKLLLVVRSFGDSNSDSGTGWSESALSFVNPNAVTAITANMTVRNFSGVSCPTNSNTTGAQVRVGGDFFNTGSGDPYDDVQAWLVAGLVAGDPTIHVGIWWGWEDQGVFTPIADFPAGTALIGSIKWDSSNHKFIASARDMEGNGAQVAVPYGMPEVKHRDTPARHSVQFPSRQAVQA